MSTNSEALLKQAGNFISTGLNLPEGSVTIGIDNVNNGEFTSSGLSFKIKGVEILDITKVEKQILEILDKVPAVKEVLQTVPEENLITKIASKLNELTQSSPISEGILKWSGFNPDIAKKDNNLHDYAIEAESNSHGVLFYINIPHDSKDENPKTKTEEVEASIKKSLPSIKATLTDTTIKYITQNLQHEGKPEAEIAQEIEKARAGMEKLDISVNLASDTRISVTIRSPEQEAAIKNNDHSQGDDTLRASNPLHELSETVLERDKQNNPDASSQLKKAVSRAFLFGGDDKIFSIIAGRRDIANAIAKEAKKNPDKQDEFNEILNSSLFKKHDRNWFSDQTKEAGRAPATPVFIIHPDKPDTIELRINEISQEKLRPIIEAIANYQVPEQAAQQQLAATQAAAATQQPQVTQKEQPSVVTGAINEVLNFFGAGKQSLSPAAG